MALRFDVLVEIALAADLTADPSTWSWTDITQYVHLSSKIAIGRGRRDWFTQSPPAKCKLTLINDSGRFVPRNPVGAYYGQIGRNTPLRVSVGPAGGSLGVQFTGYVDEWPTVWSDASLVQSLAPITCSGLLRRVQQGEVFKSALFRAHTDGYYSTGTAVAYWPCEDGSGSTSAASGVGGPAMAAFGDNLQFAGDSTILGSEPLLVLGDGGYLLGTVPTYPATTSWAIRWVMKIPSGAAGVLMFWDTPTGSGNVTWRLSLDSGTDLVHIAAYNSAGTDVIADAGVTLDGIRGGQRYFEVNATQNGTGIDWDYYVWNLGGKQGTLASSTVGNVSRVQVFAGTSALGDTTVGHIAVATDSGFGAGIYGTTGYAGERTHTRFIRLCAEETLPFTFGDLATPLVESEQAMGPQPTASLISQLREVAETEVGILHDAKDGSLAILPRSMRSNRTVELSLDVDAGTVGWPFEPTDDDQALRNDVTVSRPGGSSARATDAASVAAVGVYSDSVTVNTETDGELPSHATWRLNVGTVDELRYPQIVLNLARAASIIAAWLDADIGSRLQIANPPPELPPDTIDLHVEGYTEVFDNYTWVATLNCSPARPWQVLDLEASGNAGRLDTAGSYLLTGATAGATSLLVATPTLPAWSTTAEPYDWEIAGERVTATTVTSNAAAFVAAGTAAHADNASVTPSLPAGVQQGDLLLIFAAIRTTSGTVSTPTGYEQLLSMGGGHVKLFGKIHTGTESAPTVSFTGGAAGDTTSAVMSAFRNAQCVVQTSQQQTNASAQNIAVPGLPGVDRPGLLVLWLGWKQDDCTSVATIPGGFATEISEASTTTGNDQLLVWDYLISGNPAEPGSTTFTVTGGASAVSKGAVVSLLADVQTATVTRAVNGVSKAQSANAAVSLWRPGVLAL